MRNNDNTGAVIGFVLFMLVVMLSCAGTLYTNAHRETLVITVLNTETKIKGGSKDETYLISGMKENGEMEVFESTDSILNAKFDSADVYFKLKNNQGKQFRIVVVGYRVPVLSWNRNIITVEGPLDGR